MPPKVVVRRIIRKRVVKPDSQEPKATQSLDGDENVNSNQLNVSGASTTLQDLKTASPKSTKPSEKPDLPVVKSQTAVPPPAKKRSARKPSQNNQNVAISKPTEIPLKDATQSEASLLQPSSRTPVPPSQAVPTIQLQASRARQERPSILERKLPPESSSLSPRASQSQHHTGGADLFMSARELLQNTEDIEGNRENGGDTPSPTDISPVSTPQQSKKQTLQSKKKQKGGQPQISAAPCPHSEAKTEESFDVLAAFIEHGGMQPYTTENYEEYQRDLLEFYQEKQQEYLQNPFQYQQEMRETPFMNWNLNLSIDNLQSPNATNNHEYDALQQYNEYSPVYRMNSQEREDYAMFGEDFPLKKNQINYDDITTSDNDDDNGTMKKKQSKRAVPTGPIQLMIPRRRILASGAVGAALKQRGPRVIKAKPKGGTNSVTPAKAHVPQVSYADLPALPKGAPLWASLIQKNPRNEAASTETTAVNTNSGGASQPESKPEKGRKPRTKTKKTDVPAVSSGVSQASTSTNDTTALKTTVGTSSTAPDQKTTKVAPPSKRKAGTSSTASNPKPRRANPYIKHREQGGGSSKQQSRHTTTATTPQSTLPAPPRVGSAHQQQPQLQNRRFYPSIAPIANPTSVILLNQEGDSTANQLETTDQQNTRISFLEELFEGDLASIPAIYHLYASKSLGKEGFQSTTTQLLAKSMASQHPDVRRLPNHAQLFIIVIYTSIPCCVPMTVDQLYTHILRRFPNIDMFGHLGMSFLDLYEQTMTQLFGADVCRRLSAAQPSGQMKQRKANRTGSEWGPEVYQILSRMLQAQRIPVSKHNGTDYCSVLHTQPQRSIVTDQSEIVKPDYSHKSRQYTFNTTQGSSISWKTVGCLSYPPFHTNNRDNDLSDKLSSQWQTEPDLSHYEKAADGITTALARIHTSKTIASTSINDTLASIAKWKHVSQMLLEETASSMPPQFLATLRAQYQMQTDTPSDAISTIDLLLAAFKTPSELVGWDPTSQSFPPL